MISKNDTSVRTWLDKHANKVMQDGGIQEQRVRGPCSKKSVSAYDKCRSPFYTWRASDSRPVGSQLVRELGKVWRLTIVHINVTNDQLFAYNKLYDKCLGLQSRRAL